MSTAYGIHAKESTYDEAPASGYREVTLASDDITSKSEQLRVPGLHRGAATRTLQGVRNIDKGATGSLGFTGSPNGLGMFFALAASTAAITTPVGATLARRELFTWTADGPAAGQSLTSILYRNQYTSGLLDAWTYSGGRCTKLAVSQSSDGLLSHVWDMAYHSATPTPNADLITYTPTAPDPGFLFAYGDATITLTPKGGSGESVCLTSANWDLPTGIPEDRTRICSDAARAGMREGDPEWSGKLAMDYETQDYYTAFKNGDPFSLEAKWEAPVAIEDTTFPSLTWTIDCITFDANDPHFDDKGATTQDLPFQIVDDLTSPDPVVQLEIITTDTAL